MGNVVSGSKNPYRASFTDVTHRMAARFMLLQGPTRPQDVAKAAMSSTRAVCCRQKRAARAREIRAWQARGDCEKKIGIFGCAGFRPG